MNERVWRGIEEYKSVIQDEWSKIKQKEIQARILDMPRRCKELVRTGGKPIRGHGW